MRLGLVSDSHDSLDAVAAVLEVFRRRHVEFVLHAGDVTEPETLRAFAEHRGAVAFGNNDTAHRALRRVADEVGWAAGETWTGELGGLRVGLAHGHRRAVLQDFVRSGVDLLVTGHTHRLLDETLRGARRGVRVVNPGALFRASRYTCAVLDTERGRLDVVDVPKA